MSTQDVFTVPSGWKQKALIGAEQYQQWYDFSLNDNDSFWAEQAGRIDWIKKWDKVSHWSFKKPVSVRWYEGAELNVATNCIDRHLKDKGDKVAFYWEPENLEEPSKTITYNQLSSEVGRLANTLKSHGVKKGDRITIYMPMIPEAVYSMLACARIGAVHSVVFGGFSPEALADRIRDCDSEYLITADEGWRNQKTIPLKKNADQAADLSGKIKTMLVVQRTGAKVDWREGRDVWYHDAVADQASECPAEVMDAEDPLFVLYTSGSTGKPKGLQHTSGGYLTYAAMTHELVFNCKPESVYWCAADIGWITGHSYIVYGPLANGTTSVLYEGAPTCPDPSRLWQIVDKYKVSVLYTAPTLIRALMGEGEEWVQKTSRASLEVLGSVGEPINPEAWLWYHKNGGRGECPIVDTWWQTETGGIMITPLPGATELKPGSATRPFFGNEPAVFTSSGEVLDGAGKGDLYLKRSWPGQARTIYGDHSRFEETYFSQKDGYYCTGDECRRDEDGYYWITGRADDVLNVSGHRIGTAEVESALVAHPAVAEAAVVGFKHEIKGQGLYAYVTLNSQSSPSEPLQIELKEVVKKQIGSFAKPDFIQWAPGLPKTRSGKIMRRILRKIADNDFAELGDTSTLAEPAVVDQLIANRVR